MFAIHSLDVHYIFTICSLHGHWMFTIYSLDVKCITDCEIQILDSDFLSVTVATMVKS